VLPFAWKYAFIGLVLGLYAVATPLRIRRRLFIAGIVSTALVILFGVQDAYTKAPRITHEVDGAVFDPNDVPVPGAPVFLHRAVGPVEQLATDITGRFHASMRQSDEPAVLLICVPGTMPRVMPPVENILAAYHTTAPSLHASVNADELRSLGWRASIPQECLGGLAAH
jgi:hypothetical protein